MKRINLQGLSFTDWTVIRPDKFNYKWNQLLWLCECKCGVRRLVGSGNLLRGLSKGCGCSSREAQRRKNFLKRRPYQRQIYNMFHAIHQRCEYHKSPSYKNYGGRGIKVCKLWSNHLVFHKWCIDNGYKPGLTIDRIDNNGDYKPSNCRFISMSGNCYNKRNTRIFTYKGKQYTRLDLMKISGLTYNQIKRLTNKYPIGFVLENEIGARL